MMQSPQRRYSLRHESDYRVAVNYFTSAERAMHLCAELGARKLVAQPFHADVRDEAGFITGQKISVNGGNTLE